MKVLLIGGTGLLSAEVVRFTLEKGYETYILNRGKSKSTIDNQVTWIKADIKSKAKVLSALNGNSFDVIIDFISYSVADIKNSLDIFGRLCEQFVFISSACAYRRFKEDGVITESSPLLNPNWEYSANKVTCEAYLQEEASAIGLNYTIVRPYITYGNYRLPFGIAPAYGYHWTLVERILNSKPIFLWDNGETVCTLTHISDFSRALVGLLGNIKAYNQEFHIVGDETYSWEEILNKIGEQLGTPPIVAKIPASFAVKVLPELKGVLLGDRCLNAVFDNTKIKKTLDDFHFNISLEDGIKEVLSSYKENNYFKGMDYVWDAKMDRLVSSYNKHNKNLSFIDYLNNAKWSEKILYFTNRYIPISGSNYITKIICKLCK